MNTPTTATDLCRKAYDCLDKINYILKESNERSSARMISEGFWKEGSTIDSYVVMKPYKNCLGETISPN